LFVGYIKHYSLGTATLILFKNKEKYPVAIYSKTVKPQLYIRDNNCKKIVDVSSSM